MDGSTSASRQQRLHNPVRRRRRDASQRGLVMMTRTALACLGPVAAGAFESRQTPRRNPAADEVAITVAAASVNPIDVRRAEGYGLRLLSLLGAGKEGHEELRVDSVPTRGGSVVRSRPTCRAAASQSSHRYPQAARPSRRGFRAHQERPAWPSPSYAMMRSGAILGRYRAVGRVSPGPYSCAADVIRFRRTNAS